jgi:hypothetical protein
MVAPNIRKRLISPALSGNQFSITEIPRKLYAHFYKNRIGNEVKTETWGEIRLWFELPTNSNDKTDKVIAVFTEMNDNEAIETKFALMPWYPADEHFGNLYDFEIFAVPQSKGWSHGEGNRFIETLSYQTKNDLNHPLVANHPMVDYIAQALIEMRNILKDPVIVRQEFIDNAPKPPR